MAAPLKKVVDNDRLVDNDREGQRFRVSRTACVSNEILALERANIFDTEPDPTKAEVKLHVAIDRVTGTFPRVAFE